MAGVRRGVWTFVALGLLVTLALAGVASYYASNAPDGLEKVAQDVGLGERARQSVTSGSPLAGYGVTGVDDARLSVGLAGIAGVVITGLLAFGLFLWLGRRRSAADAASREPATNVPASSQPLSSQPLSSRPLSSRPLSSEPASSRSLSSEPASSRSLSSEPASSQPASTTPPS